MENSIINYGHTGKIQAVSLANDKQKLEIKTERQKLSELDKEWNIDRILLMNFSVLVFAQLFAARKKHEVVMGTAHSNDARGNTYVTRCKMVGQMHDY
jgi:ribosomal protein L18